MSVLKKNLVIVLAPGVAELEGGGMRRRKRRKGVRLSTWQNLQIIPYDFRERKIQNIVGYFHSAESISGNGVCQYVCMSSLQRWSIRLLVGLADPYNHTYSESLWWKLFKNHQRTQIQRQRQWQRQWQRQRHGKSAWNTHLMLYFWNPDDLLIPNMIMNTSHW